MAHPPVPLAGRVAENAEPLSAFTLVEVILALVVMAMGVLAAFMLMGSATDTGTRIAAGTQVAVFAEGTLNAVRAAADEAARSERTNSGSWDRFWTGFATTQQLSAPYSGAWESDVAIRPNTYRTNHYVNYPFRTGGPTNVVDHSIRYRLNVAYPSGPDGTRADVLLKVWEGAYGPTTDTAAAIFYTEFPLLGDL